MCSEGFCHSSDTAPLPSGPCRRPGIGLGETCDSPRRHPERPQGGFRGKAQKEQHPHKITETRGRTRPPPPHSQRHGPALARGRFVFAAPKKRGGAVEASRGSPPVTAGTRPAKTGRTGAIRAERHQSGGGRGYPQAARLVRGGTRSPPATVWQ